MPTKGKKGPLKFAKSCQKSLKRGNEGGNFGRASNSRRESSRYGGYFRPDDEKAQKAMRPSETLNKI